MASTPTRPQWVVYEQRVFELFKEHFPKASVRKNVRTKGRLSKRNRQIDILISERTPAGQLRTVVDTKCFKRKVDVKVVDGFAGFVEDIGAHKGMLITSRGYSQAALRRAYYSPRPLELDILNFSALQGFQGFGAIPYSGKNGFVIPAPLGWVIDGTQGKGFLACVYQRGLDAESAIKRKELIYINFWDREKNPLSAADLDRLQVAGLKQVGPVTVKHRATVQRSDAVTRLRIADVPRYKCLEVTGFVEFRDVIFFAVLLTARETQRPNIRRLESILRQAIPMKMTYDHTARIGALQEQLRGTLNAVDRALHLREVARLQREMGKFEDARQQLEESMKVDPGNAYWVITELLPVLAKLGEPDRAKEIMALLLRLDPHNPTVFNDCLAFAAGWIEGSEVLGLIDTLKTELPNDQLALASCDFYAGKLLMADAPSLARDRFVAARERFRGVFPPAHQVFRALRLALERCNGPGRSSRSRR